MQSIIKNKQNLTIEIAIFLINNEGIRKEIFEKIKENRTVTKECIHYLKEDKKVWKITNIIIFIISFICIYMVYYYEADSIKVFLKSERQLFYLDILLVFYFIKVAYEFNKYKKFFVEMYNNLVIDSNFLLIHKKN